MVNSCCQVIEIEPGEQDNIPDKCYAKLVGNSYAIFVPTDNDLVDALGLTMLKDDDGPERINLASQQNEGKYGEYGEIWNNRKQRDDAPLRGRD